MWQRSFRVTAEANAGLRPPFGSALPTAGGLPSVDGLRYLTSEAQEAGP
jgi:hypothetical protein